MICMTSMNAAAAPLLAADDGGGIGQLIAIAVVIGISLIGTVWGKLRDKKEQGQPRQPRRVPRADGSGQVTRPPTPRPAVPQRRPPVRATPARARPPRPVQAQAGPMPSQQVPIRKAAPSRSDQPVPKPVQRGRPPSKTRQRQRSAELGSGATRAAESVAQHADKRVADHARRAVADHTRRSTSHLAEEGRLGGTRLSQSAQSASAPAVGGMAIRGRLSRNDLRRAIVLAEILGPPVSERDQQ